MKVTMYKDKSGGLHASKSAWLVANQALQLRPELEAAIAEIPVKRWTILEYPVGTGEKELFVSRAGLSELVIDNADAFRKILNGSLTIKRKPRAKKSVAGGIPEISQQAA